MSDELSNGPRPITVRTFKYDGSAHRCWQALLQERDGELLVLDAEFAQEIEHDLMGTIELGTKSTEYYWLDRWYNVFRFATAEGVLKHYYCNVNVPPVFDGSVLTYIDLDVDVLVAPDFSYRVIDLDEFEANTIRYHYPEELRRKAEEAVDQIIASICARAFPFG